MRTRVLGFLLVCWCFFGTALAQSVSLPSSAVVGQNISAEIILSNLDTIQVGAIEWGDGQSSIVPAGAPSSTRVLNHVYGSAGSFKVQLICNSVKNALPVQPMKRSRHSQSTTICPQAFALIVVSFPTPILSLSPNPAEPNQTVTASISGLSGALAYRLDWGDGVIDDLSNKTSATLTHQFTTAKTYTIRLTEGRSLVAPQIVVLQVQRKNPGLSVSPSAVFINEDVTASLTQLYADLTYTLEWGDGTSEIIAGQTTKTLKKKFDLNGTKIVKLSASGLAPQIASVLVSVPKPELEVVPDASKVGVVMASLSNLFPKITYLLDWGDGSAKENITGVSSAKLQHTYPANAKPVYVVQVTFPGGVVTATVQMLSSCSVVFTPDNPSPNQSLKAVVSGLPSNAAFSIDWGDKNSDVLTSNSVGVGTAVHSYLEAKIYTVQVKLENKLLCLGGLNVGSVTVIAGIQLESVTQAGLIVTSAYPDETINLILEPLTQGASYTLDYGDGRPKLSFIAAKNEKRRVVPVFYTLQKQFVLTLIQKAKSVSTTLKVALPEVTEQIKAKTEARAELPVIFETTKLLAAQNYELEFGNKNKVVVQKNADGISGQASQTYQKAGQYNLGLFWIGKKGTRIKRASLKIQVLEAFTAQVFSSTLYFKVDKNAVSKFGVTKFGTNTLNPAELTIVYKGFGVLEGDVLLNSQITTSLKIVLKKNGGEDVGNGKRRLILPFKNFVLNQIGTLKIIFQPTKLNGSVFSSQSDQPLEIFVYPQRFVLAGFDFDVKYASGSLDSMNGKANVHLVFAQKDFGVREVEFSKLKAEASIDPELSTAQKISFIPGEASITKGSIKTYLGNQEFNTLGKIRLQLSQVVFQPSGTQFTGEVRIPYPTCPISPIITQKPPPSKETKPDPIFEIFPEKNKPYPADKLSEILENSVILETTDKLGEAVFEDIALQDLANLGVINFPMPAVQKFGAKQKGSRFIRTSNQVPQVPKAPIITQLAQQPEVRYDYVVPLENLELDANGGFYLANAQADIEGYVANAQDEVTKTFSAPKFNSANSNFSLACSGVALPSSTTLTVDLSSLKSPASDALLDTYGGTNAAPDVGAAWRGVLFPKANTTLDFVDTSGYGAEASKQGFSLKEPIPANVTYDNGYNWSITKNEGLGAGVVNAWKFNVSSFGMSMYHSKIVSGGGKGTFFLPFFVLDTPGRFFIGAVQYNVTPTWEIVTDEFIQQDFGSSSVVAGCGVFAHESGSYPLKFASAFWAVKRLVKTPSNLNLKRLNWQPLRQGQRRLTQGSIFNNIKAHYAKIRLTGGVDTQSHCNPKEALKGKISTDAGLTIALPNLRVFPNANIDLNGQMWRTINAPKLELAGQLFPASQLGIGKNPDGTHFIALRSNDFRLAPCDQNNASDCLPAVSTEMRYPIQNGKDLGKVILKGFTISSTMNQNTKFKQTFADKEIALSGKLYALENAPNEIWLEQYNKNTGLGALAAASNDFCFESSNSGFCPEPSPVSAASNTMNMGGIAVIAQMFVRRQNGKTSWGVYAGALSETPLASLFGAVNVYGLYGGIVYNKRWDSNVGYTNLATDFAFNKLQDANGLQIVAGTVFTVLDGSSFHGAGVLFIDLNNAFAITINVTGWLLTPYSSSTGYLGKQTPQARALIQMNSSGLSADLCIGNTGTPPNAKIQCQGLSNLKLSKLAEISGYASLAVGSQNHIYIGTYNNPITLTVLPDISAFKTQATGYLMLGQVDANSGIPPTAISNTGSQTGIYAGFSIKRDIRVGDSGSIDLLVTSCNWSWYAEAGWSVSADFGLTVQPSFEMNAQFAASAYAGAGASGCGIGIDINITGTIKGGIKVTTNSATVNYSFSGSISTPSPLPDINFSKDGTLDLYKS
jgi:hypothetical protein